jgi:MFS transporter, ACS family, hexuronate transporter
MLHAFRNSVASFPALRYLLGTGEAGNSPAAVKAITGWFRADQRSTAVGIVTAGTSLGGTIVPPAAAG